MNSNWTVEDLRKVRAARLEFTLGKGVVEITFSSGHSVKYLPGDAALLKALEVEIMCSLSPVKKGPIRVGSSKGL